MVFNSVNFAYFFVIVYVLYWFVFRKTAKGQNLILLLSSIAFYLIADWKFIFLLAASGLINFLLAKKIASEEDESLARKSYFYFGVIFNIGILIYFKYFNFFIESFVDLFNWSASSDINFTPFHILLPLGISFYTFQVIGYLIDVNNEEIEPNYSVLNYATYLAYFPKLLSGPIEKIQDFIPQIEKKREFNYHSSVDGVRQFLWGLFKKIVIADNCTSFVDIIYNTYPSLSGATVLLGSLLYIISIYADFSGFSDMACGVSKMFNIKIMNNFNFPFFATNISDYWKKWHISLTSWMMNYVYTPLSFIFRRMKKGGLILSVFITFLLVGLWHGANLTFVIFGVLHGIYFIPIIIWGNISSSSGVGNNGLKISEFAKMTLLFILVSLTSVFFRASSVGEAFAYLKVIASKSLFQLPSGADFMGSSIHPISLALFLVGFFIIEWINKNYEYGLQRISENIYLRGFIYFSLLFLILFTTNFHSSKEFIYFQF